MAESINALLKWEQELPEFPDRTDIEAALLEPKSHKPDSVL